MLIKWIKIGVHQFERPKIPFMIGQISRYRSINCTIHKHSVGKQIWADPCDKNSNHKKIGRYSFEFTQIYHSLSVSLKLSAKI